MGDGGYDPAEEMQCEVRLMSRGGWRSQVRMRWKKEVNKL